MRVGGEGLHTETRIALIAAAVAINFACGGTVETTGARDGGGQTDQDGSTLDVNPGDVGLPPGDGGTRFESGSGADASPPTDEGGHGGPPSDAGKVPPWDADIADGLVEDASFDAPAAAAGLAGFAFVVNDVVLTPMACPDVAWEYALPAGETSSPPDNPPTKGVNNAYIVNTGTLPLAYVAQSLWSPNQQPGVLTGTTYQLAGLLMPGTQVDITPVYVGGYTAIVGSSEPFTSLDSGHPFSDEGSILWPPGVAGSGGASLMYVAQIEVPYSPPSHCNVESSFW
jgi:hypothetical protein